MPLDAFVETSAERAMQAEGSSSTEGSSDTDSEDDGGESDFDESDAPVLSLGCVRCGTVVSERGVQVLLVADPSSSLYSTDIPTDFLVEDEQRTIPTCQCFARDVSCRQCLTVVGYHVLTPCAVCSASEHNGHFWLFDQGAVDAAKRGDLTWSQLPYNGAPVSVDPQQVSHGDASHGDAAAGDRCGDADEDEDESCCICAARPMWRRTRVEGCQHEFCWGCISREVDARGACPLDRRPITRDMLTACAPIAA